MIDYLKPLIWVLLAVGIALGLHVVMRLMQPAAVGLGSAVTHAGHGGPDGLPPSMPGVDSTAPTRELPPVAPPDAGPPSAQPPKANAVTPTGAVGAAGVGRVGLAQWEKALTQNGFVKEAYPKLHAGDPQYTSLVFRHNGVEAAWAFLQTPTGDGLVARLEFYVDGKEAVTLDQQPAATAACQAIVNSCRALDQALADAIMPVLYSPYTGPEAFEVSPNSVYKGFARDIGHYIALRVTPRGDPPGGQFLLLWKDPKKQYGALQISLDFAAKCEGAKWETFKAQ